MEKTLCGDCGYFIRHYANVGNYYIKTEYGHCAWPSIRARKVNSTACNYFQERTADFDLKRALEEKKR